MLYSATPAACVTIALATRLVGYTRAQPPGEQSPGVRAVRGNAVAA